MADSTVIATIGAAVIGALATFLSTSKKLRPQLQKLVKEEEEATSNAETTARKDLYEAQASLARALREERAGYLTEISNLWAENRKQSERIMELERKLYMAEDTTRQLEQCKKDNERMQRHISALEIKIEQLTKKHEEELKDLRSLRLPLKDDYG